MDIVKHPFEKIKIITSLDGATLPGLAMLYDEQVNIMIDNILTHSEFTADCIQDKKEKLR